MRKKNIGKFQRGNIRNVVEDTTTDHTDIERDERILLPKNPTKLYINQFENLDVDGFLEKLNSAKNREV